MTGIPKSLALLATLLVMAVCSADGDEPLRFNAEDHGEPGNTAPVMQPWRTVTLDPTHGGMWVVTGDVDGDGAVDVISARNVNEGDVHYTSTAVAQRLDGSVIWRWGNPDIGRREWHHDVALQVTDWDDDGANEIVLLTEGFLVELNGATGAEVRRFPIPAEATDCLVFCHISGGEHADVLVKDRYRNVYAYDWSGRMLWTVKEPGGYRTSHQPRPYDLDGDGLDEIMAGYAMLDHDGSIMWVLSSDTVELSKGHLDLVRPMRTGTSPRDWVFVGTYCGAGCLACFDGAGKTMWEVPGFHYESVNVGRVFPDAPAPQIAVDIDHVPRGESPVELFDSDGNRLARLTSDYCRHHKLFDVDGDGLDELVLANARGVFDNTGKRILTLACDSPGVAMQPGDMDGDGRTDIGIVTDTSFHIFRFPDGPRVKPGSPSGCGVNFSLY